MWLGGGGWQPCQYVNNISIWGREHFSSNINLHCDVDWSSQNLAVVPKFRMIGNASESFHHPQDSQQDDEREDRGEKEFENLARSQVIYYKVPVFRVYMSEASDKYFQVNSKFSPNLIFYQQICLWKSSTFHHLLSFYLVFHSTNVKDWLLKCIKSSAESFAITVPS